MTTNANKFQNFFLVSKIDYIEQYRILKLMINSTIFTLNISYVKVKQNSYAQLFSEAPFFRRFLFFSFVA